MIEPGHAGELVWRRHERTSNPSRHALRATCMELLPLVKMYCRWELQDDCSNLRELMVRFDLEAELETHELGRSLLLLLRDDDAGMDIYTQRMHFDAPPNPFNSIRSRLAEIDTAFRALKPQVRLPVELDFQRTLVGMPAMAFSMPKLMFPMMWRNKNFTAEIFCLPFSALSGLPWSVLPCLLLSAFFLLWCASNTLGGPVHISSVICGVVVLVRLCSRVFLGSLASLASEGVAAIPAGRRQPANLSRPPCMCAGASTIGSDFLL